MHPVCAQTVHPVPHMGAIAKRRLAKDEGRGGEGRERSGVWNFSWLTDYDKPRNDRRGSSEAKQGHEEQGRGIEGWRLVLAARCA